MDRKIVINVNGSHLRKDNDLAGVTGEGNSTTMNIIFDNGWEGMAKTVTFWNARGQNPVKRTLTADMLTDLKTSILDYSITIPPEPLEYEGRMTFVIDGYVDGVRRRSLSDTLKVRYSPMDIDAGEPIDPTPTQAEQLQKQIDTLLDDIQEEAIKAEDAADRSESAASRAEYAEILAERHKNDARTYAEAAEEACSDAEVACNNAEDAYESAKTEREAAEDAREAAEDAQKKAEDAKAAAEEAVMYAPMISDVTGNWMVYDLDKEMYIDTGHKAQGKTGDKGDPGDPGDKGDPGVPGRDGYSGVYIGTDTPPESANVWIYPGGEPFQAERWEFVLKDGTEIYRNVWVFYDEAPDGAEDWEFELEDGTPIIKKVVCI